MGVAGIGHAARAAILYCVPVTWREDSGEDSIAPAQDREP